MDDPPGILEGRRHGLVAGDPVDALDASSRRTNPSSRSNDWFSSINTTTCWISSFQAIAVLLPVRS